MSKREANSPLVETISKELNPAQAEAALTTDGPLLILAGAGSGKTRVLTYRMAHIIGSRLASPDEILAVTFTNKAAREMETRILSLLQRFAMSISEPLWVSTFHAFCVRILRANIHLLDYKPFFAIYDQTDQLAMIKKVLVRLDINDKAYPAKNFQSRINNAKMLALTVQDLRQQARSLLDEKSVAVYEAYEQDMHLANALDFADLLLKTHQLFSYYPDLLQTYQEKFKYIMVDEYQDTNHIQYLLVHLLSQAHKNLCVVGDEDQSIYSWRGADIRNILSFEEDYRNCKTVKLEENYRSSRTIVEAASALIKNNTERKSKTLFSNREQGERIRIQEEANEYDEARFVVQQIYRLISQDTYNLRDVAIFYRTNAQSRVLEEQLRSQGLAYRIVGGVKFYERLEIKDILGYLKILLNPQDDIAYKRIINTPARGIGKSTVDRIEQWAGEQRVSLLTATRQIVAGQVMGSGPLKKLKAFLDLIDELLGKASSLRLSELYHLVLDKTEYVTRLQAEDSAESQARIENLEELDNAIRQFEKERGDEGTLQNFLEEMALVSDVDQMKDEENTVTLMTLHIAKGLEFPVVFIVGLEEGLFPTGRARDENDNSDFEEERRLAYVGITRARELLFLTHARCRRVWGNEQYNPPSRFLGEIPEVYTDRQSALARPKFFNQHSTSAVTQGRDRLIESATAAGPHKPGLAKRQHGRAIDPFPDYESADYEHDSFDEIQASSYSPGMRVRHPTFGAGNILQVEGNGEMQKVSVVFADRSVKKFVAKYARLEVF